MLNVTAVRGKLKHNGWLPACLESLLHVQNRVCLSTDDGTDDGSVGALIGEETHALSNKAFTCRYLLGYSSL